MASGKIAQHGVSLQCTAHVVWITGIEGDAVVILYPRGKAAPCYGSCLGRCHKTAGKSQQRAAMQACWRRRRSKARRSTCPLPGKKIVKQFKKRPVAKTLPHMPQPRFPPVLAVSVFIEKGNRGKGKGRSILKGQLLPQHYACGRPGPKRPCADNQKDYRAVFPLRYKPEVINPGLTAGFGAGGKAYLEFSRQAEYG